MNKLSKIKSDLKGYMKDKNESKKATLRLLLSEIEKEKIALNNGELTDEQVETVIARQIKKVNKEIEAYKSVNQPVDSQLAEIEFLKTYLPEQLSEEEIRKVIEHSLELVERGEIKNPMQYVGSRLKGKADMKLVFDIVKGYNK